LGNVTVRVVAVNPNGFLSPPNVAGPKSNQPNFQYHHYHHNSFGTHSDHTAGNAPFLIRRSSFHHIISKPLSLSTFIVSFLFSLSSPKTSHSLPHHTHWIHTTHNKRNIFFLIILYSYKIYMMIIIIISYDG